ncbi:MAG: hypothetical protein IJW40_09630 [Clostridia bacterium]|nr:hypothetical protein [Clostridia bacterium]
MKTRWIALILGLCCICTGLVACTDEEMLPENFEQSEPEAEGNASGEPERVEDNVPIDTTRFDENDYAMTLMGRNEFLNAHGMVFIQEGELCYVNKASKVTSSFCMDALCEHEMGWCPAVFFGGMSELAEGMRIYSPADGKLYGSRADATIFGSNDGNLYSMTVDTMESKKVFSGNGNELRFFQVQGDYVYVTRNLKDGGLEHIRYNVKTEKAEILTPPEGKIFSNLWVGNRHMIVMFMDEFELYKVNETFDTYEKLDSNITGINILHGDYIYNKEILEDGTVNYYSYHLLTKEKHVFATDIKGMGIFQTVSDTHLYLTDNNQRALYRIALAGENNRPELVFHTATVGGNGRINGMKYFDGEIYLSFEVGDGGIPSYAIPRCGNLVEGENGWEFVDFKQGRRLE